MKSLPRLLVLFLLALPGLMAFRPLGTVRAADQKPKHTEFRTSDRCVACHNGLKTSTGQDISIGFDWRASIMANSARDPYWQGSVRRETIDHPELSSAIQDECSTCHMPMAHLDDKAHGRQTEVFSRLPLTADHKGSAEAADGVSCSVCHQIAGTGLGKPETFSGNVVIADPNAKNHHPEYGPFVVDQGHQTIMVSSTAGFVPTVAGHIRDSGLCGSCHTLYTTAHGQGGKELGPFPEQMPYLEWLHSDYPSRQTCQECHMPEVKEAVRRGRGLRAASRRHAPAYLCGSQRADGAHLNDHREELGVEALPQELAAAHAQTSAFLEKSTARVSITSSRDGHAWGGICGDCGEPDRAQAPYRLPVPPRLAARYGAR